MNQPDPFLGVILHAIGGLASASFYLPFRRVRGWSWESYWLVGGVFSWIAAPWFFALIQTPNLIRVLVEAPARALLWTYLFGVLWGIGGLTFGLTMRYLGIALGMAMALGYCAAFGTLMPPLFRGELESIARTTAGATVLSGVVVCLAGIVVSGLAGRSKERELTAEQKQAVIHEFSFVKGVLVATVSGILSACMSYGFAAGKPIAELAVQHGAHPLWQNLPVLVVVLAGGFTTNFLWCLLPQHPQSHRGRIPRRDPRRECGFRRSLAEELRLLCRRRGHLVLAVPLLRDGEHVDGQVRVLELDPPHGQHHDLRHGLGADPQGMEGFQPRTHLLNATALVILVSSTVIVGYGNYLATQVTSPPNGSVLPSKDLSSSQGAPHEA